MTANESELRASPPAELVVESIDKWFRTDRTTTHAIGDVSFRVAGGEFVCLVGQAAAVNRRVWISLPASPHRIRAACLPMGSSCRVPGGTVW
jgi:hypothetical protein